MRKSGAAVIANSRDQRRPAFPGIQCFPDLLARKIANKPLELTQAPTREIKVIVTQAGAPVADCIVSAYGVSEGANVRTAADGTASLFVPENTQLRYVAAFHPEAGVAGWQAKDTSAAEGQNFS